MIRRRPDARFLRIPRARDPRIASTLKTHSALCEPPQELTQDAQIHVTYVVYTDEGHGFGRPENRLDFTAREEKFIARYLGGRLEPMAGERMPGSAGVVRVIGN